MLAAELADAIHGLADAGGGFSVHHRQDPGLVELQTGFDLFEAEGFTPGLLDGAHVGAVAAGHVLQAQAEVALHGHQHGVARLDHVGDGGLHGGRTGAAHRQGEPVVRLPDVTQQLLHLAHQGDIQRIEMADRRAAQSLQHRGVGIGWSRTQQQPVRCGDRAE